MAKLGRPTLDEVEKTVNLSVSVTVTQAKFLKDYGFGNISLAIRRLVDEKREDWIPTPSPPYGWKEGKDGTPEEA